MPLARLRSLCALVALILAAGCGDEGVSGPTITLSGHTMDALTKAPAAGVRACIYARSDIACAITDSAGNYELVGVPANTKLWVSYTGDDLLPQLTAFETGTTDDSWIHNVLKNALFEAQATLAEAPIDPTKGHISGGAFDRSKHPKEGVPGFSVTIAPDGGDGPIYANDSGMPDRSLATSSTMGTFAVLNVPPGTYTVTYAGGTCTPLFGWNVDGAANTLEIKVVAGIASWVSHVCE